MSLIAVVFGLPGSGKSTLARRLARRIGAQWISSDAIRVERGLRGDYRKASIAAVYAEMMARARSSLSQGRAVVLDGSFSSRDFREAARLLAQEAGARLALIRMVANEETTLARVGRKRLLTEAGPAAYRLLKDHFDPIEGEHLVLDSSQTDLGPLLARAEEYLTSTLKSI
jgi:predicted kinase